MLRWLLRIATLVLFVISARMALSYWQYDEYAVDIAKLFSQQVTPQTLSQALDKALADNHPDEARMYLKLAETFALPLDKTAYETKLQELESPLNTAMRTVTEFKDGFLDGSAESGVGVIGAITSDFTVVGDVRDLWEQYDLYTQNQPTNDLIIALAGVGVGLTAATVMSAGSASPAKMGVSVFKIATRTGRLTPRFQAYLTRQASSVFDTKTFLRSAKQDQTLEGITRAVNEAYQPAAVETLSELATRTNAIRQVSSLMDTVHLLQYVESADDLRRLEKLTVKYGTETKGIMKLLGKSAIGTVRVLRRTTELVLSLMSTLLSFLGMLLVWRR
ncbi:MAG: hypothetical protein WAQ53_14990 [Thiofilum sp.]|uniref:hypothetical protein n=1 Tax=Thiofilum sp. TaxID=2212733 RepID=UPI0025E6A761|nr:hypothetical protein [Thiofilum sp.]MBK8451847.1 hypothetical protein [Thiofilum sp.]